MKMLGLNPMEQEIVDLTNTITKNGFIYFPDFCKIVVKRWREDDEEMFRQNMFKVSRTKSMYPGMLFCSLFEDPVWYRALPRAVQSKEIQAS